MYFPYVYGKQSELLALRAIAQEALNVPHIVPIIEPVKTNTANISRCLSTMAEANGRAIVILNPSKDEFTVWNQAWYESVISVLNKYTNLLPAFISDSRTTKAHIASFLSAFQGRWVALLHQGTSLTPLEMAEIAAAPNVLFHINVRDKTAPALLAHIPSNKRVDIKDNFSKLARNADYLGNEFFSDDYRNYRQSSAGFGDYTVIGSSYEVGGGKPGAIAIHTTYKCPTTSAILVEHFVSDDKDRDVGDVASKYLQAVNKLCGAVQSRPYEFGDNTALREYQHDQRNSLFPALGKNKERQIRHHIDLVSALLANRL